MMGWFYGLLKMASAEYLCDLEHVAKCSMGPQVIPSLKYQGNESKCRVLCCVDSDYSFSSFQKKKGSEFDSAGLFPQPQQKVGLFHCAHLLWGIYHTIQ